MFDLDKVAHDDDSMRPAVVRSSPPLSSELEQIDLIAAQKEAAGAAAAEKASAANELHSLLGVVKELDDSNANKIKFQRRIEELMDAA